MCGICGFIWDDTESGEVSALRGRFTERAGKAPVLGSETRPAALEAMMNAIHHRGPDDGRMYLDDGAALGFRRLAIIDTAGSAQPMKNETGSIVLVFNGEIYNYQELREELISLGHQFRTKGDSEVLLHGYEEWKENLPERLRGMFAFAVWDAGRKELFLARDYFGIKPLYYALIGNVFLFGSEIKSILEYPGVKRELNEEALEQYLSFQYSVLEETFFKGIYRLEPGACLKYRAGKPVLKLRRYFVPELAPEREDARKAEEEQWKKAVDKVMRDSVRAHMQADVEVGAFLSGGVDSAYVAALLSRENQEGGMEEEKEADKAYGKRAYTVGFETDGCRYNEISKAGQIAAECGLRHKSRLIREREFWEAVPEVLYYLDEPLGDASAVALYFLAREASREVKAVVSGEGADELFGGYQIYCEPASLRPYQLLPEAWRKAAAKLAERLPDVKGKQFLIRGSLGVEERFIGNARIFSYEERRKILKKPTQAVPPARLLEKDYERTKGMRDADRMQEIDLRRWLAGDILMKADRMSMAHSLELRVPFLDREVFALARRLPGSQKQRGRTTKRILRRAAAAYLNADAAERPKLGFPVPIRVWLRGDDAQERLLYAFRGTAAQKYFRREELLRLLEEHRNGRKDNSRRLWTVYVFCVWYDIYFRGQ